MGRARALASLILRLILSGQIHLCCVELVHLGNLGRRMSPNTLIKGIHASSGHLTRDDDDDDGEKARAAPGSRATGMSTR